MPLNLTSIDDQLDDLIDEVGALKTESVEEQNAVNRINDTLTRAAEQIRIFVNPNWHANDGIEHQRLEARALRKNQRRDLRKAKA